MSVTRLSPLCLILIIASPVLGTYYPYGYPDFQPAPLSFGPHLIYGPSESSGGNAASLTGFSYFTKDFGGGESDVVFFTGPNSDVKMTEEVAAVKGQMNLIPPATTAETKSDKVELPSSTEVQNAAEISAPIATEIKESSTAVKPEETTAKAAESKTEDKKEPGTISVTIEGQSERGSGFETPYPILRLSHGAATSYYPHQFSAPSFSDFARYEPSDYFRSQYVPFYNQYNSYQSLFNPLYPALDTDYYNPAVFPSFYQAPIISHPSSVENNFISEKPEGGVKSTTDISHVPIDRRLGVEQKPSTDSSPKNFDQSSTEVSTSEKKTELPTSTELVEEKTTAASESAPTTTAADEVKEDATTTVVSDASAAP